MASKFYAVKKGKVPGIYLTWDECKKMVDGYSGAVYKSFKTRVEAEEFIGNIFTASATKSAKAAGMGQGAKGTDVVERRKCTSETASGAGHTGNVPEVYAFVDGSYNIATKVYGFGGFLVHNGTKEILQGSGSEEEMASMRNVAGEILGSMAAVKKAVELGLSEVTIYYDYMGIEMWANGDWKRNKAGTIAYFEYMQSVREQIAVHFVKVKGHSGVEGNEEADRLAKEAVGIIA